MIERNDQPMDILMTQSARADWLPASEGISEPPPGLWLLLATWMVVSLLIIAVAALIF